MIAHELRTPITIINGNGKLLQHDGAALSQQERAQAIDDICDEAERLRLLVEGLMMLGDAAGPDHLEGQLEPVYVEPIVERVILRHRRHQPQRAMRLDVTTPRMPALGVPGYIEQIIDNFLANALKYSANTSSVEVVVAVNGGHIVVEVLDRGIGIQPGEEDLVFTPFFRSMRGAKMAGGSGIGLAVCHRLAHAQGGGVWARPRDGGGSEFGVSIPVAFAPVGDDDA